MTLWNWKMMVSMGTANGGKELFLAVKVELKCPYCGEIAEIETRPRSFDAGKDFLLGWKVREIGEPRKCPNCGIWSGLPDKDERLLQLELEKRIAPWFKP